MPKGRSTKQQGRLRRLSSAMPFWQRAVLSFYIALFALVLPLICWGALAEPGHPHRAPHFVFAAPLLATPRPRAAMPNRSPHQLPIPAATEGHRQHGTLRTVAASQEPAAAMCDLFADGVIAGRATPMLMAVSLLLLIFLSVWTAHRFDRPQVVLWQRPPFPESLFLPVPLRPPRLRFAPFVG